MKPDSSGIPLSPLRRRVLAAALTLPWFGAALAARYHGKDVSTQGIGGDFRLTDHQGRLRQLADFRGKIVLMFFGYTRCPDVCPTTLSRMAEVMKLLGAEATRVQVLWMTVDPERDTQALLANYVPAFNPGFLGLRGTEAQTEKVADAFRIRYQIIEYKGQYLVDHTASGYLIDGTGRTRLLLPYDMTAAEIAADVRTVLAGG